MKGKNKVKDIKITISNVICKNNDQSIPFEKLRECLERRTCAFNENENSKLCLLEKTPPIKIKIKTI